MLNANQEIKASKKVLRRSNSDKYGTAMKARDWIKSAIYIQDHGDISDMPGAGENFETAGRLYLKEGRVEEAISAYSSAAEVYGRCAYDSVPEAHSRQEAITNQEMKRYFIDRQNNALRMRDRLTKLAGKKWHGLEGKVAAVAAFALFLAGALSTSITGYTVVESSASGSAGLGVFFFLAALGILALR